MVEWRKRGRIYAPGGAGRHPKLASHAANPLAVHLEGDVFRVFYSGRDARNRSSVGAVDVDIVAGRVVRDHPEPVIEHGPPGSFHADGISIGCVYRAASGARYMLFMAWQSQGLAHWRGDIGRFRLTDDLGLVPDPDTAFLGADPHDPVSLSYPWVERSGTGYVMWYGSTWTWDAGNGEMIHVINHATSDDGETWQRRGLAVPMEIGRAQAFSRPTVLIHADGRHDMWFSFRAGGGDRYRIGRARSADGVTWALDLDGAGIAPSAEGWDSEMIEYPFVFRHDGRAYMLYNGNGHGRTGFGLAEAA
jgi:hypothetical protein